MVVENIFKFVNLELEDYSVNLISFHGHKTNFDLVLLIFEHFVPTVFATSRKKGPTPEGTIYKFKLIKNDCLSVILETVYCPLMWSVT